MKRLLAFLIGLLTVSAFSYAPQGDRFPRLPNHAACHRTNLAETIYNGGANVSRNFAWQFDPLYRITTETITGHSYDDNGNTLTGMVSPAPASADLYDFENRLIRRYDGILTITIVYNADGHRVRKEIQSGANTTVVRYLVDDLNPTGYAQVLEEWQSLNGGAVSLRRAYTYGHDLISQRQNSGVTHYYGYDGHGNVRLLLSDAGAVTDAYSYDAFGLLIHEWHAGSATPNHYLYCGEQWDGELGTYYLRARYLNPATGRFWTMDSYEGNSSDPLTLHKYLYAHGNPVNMWDPSGNNSDVISLNISGALVASLAAFTAASIYEAKTHAIGNLMAAAWTQTMTETDSAIAAAESALSVARTSVRKLLDEAKEILKQTGQALRQIKVVPIPRSIIPNVANHVATAQASGHPMVLTRVAPAVAAANRRAALAGRGPAGPSQSWDEYPFASGRNPRSLLRPSVVAVPWLENSIQGGIIGACYRLEKINVGTPYIVVVTP